jgi:hypothetical protein
MLVTLDPSFSRIGVKSVTSTATHFVEYNIKVHTGVIELADPTPPQLVQ